MKKSKSVILTIFGMIMLAGGLILLKIINDPQGNMRALPYVLVGIGCGVFGHGLGSIISYRTMRNQPQKLKQIEIEQKDERNIAISNRAKAKSYDLMIFVFGALMISFALMGVDMIAVLLLVSAYLFVVFYNIYYRIKYDKEM